MPTVAKVKVKTAVKKKAVKEVPVTAVKLEIVKGDVFNQPINQSLLSQYVRVYQSNQRQGNAHTKTRGDVAGSGKKPWKQKGTGRARVGSIRTPVWRHGGVSHGPVIKDWSLNFSKKMKSGAFRMVLSQKVAQSQVFSVDKIELMEGRTKELLGTLGGWNLVGSTLIVSTGKNLNLLKGARNLKNISVVNHLNLNAYQILVHDQIVFEKEAFNKIQEKYAKTK